MFFTTMFLACSEYAIIKEQPAADTFSPSVTTSDTAATPLEPNDEDTGADDTAADTATEPADDDSLDDDGCWFAAWEYYNDYDIGVKTLPVYQLVSPADITVARGEDVTLEFAASSYNECGDFDFNMLFFGVYDDTDGSYTWLKPVNDDAIDSYLDDLSGTSEFDPYAADNMYCTPTGNELQYFWNDGVYGDTNYPINMSTERVGATEEKHYQFTWTASNYAPSGTTITVMLTEVCWTDVTTNALLCSTRQGLDGIEMTVHIE